MTIELNADNEQVLAYETGYRAIWLCYASGCVADGRVKSLVCVGTAVASGSRDDPKTLIGSEKPRFTPGSPLVALITRMYYGKIDQ